MTIDVIGIGDDLQELSSGKFHRDWRRVAFQIGTSQDTLLKFFMAIKQRGQGVRADGTWQPNPSPYDDLIDIESQADNILNLFKCTAGRKVGNYSILTEPSPAVLKERCDYCLLGSPRLRSNITNAIKPTDQREMVGMIIGTNRYLNDNYPVMAEERCRIWKDWASGGSNSELYDTGHLPYMLMHYRQVWDITLPPGYDGTKITAGMKRAGKREIINLLVDMFVLPQSCLDELDRHSGRLSGSLSPQQ